MDIVLDEAKKNNGFDPQVASNCEECASLWKVRKECLWSAMGAFPERYIILVSDL